MPAQDRTLFFEQGFPMEEPRVVLPWNKPLGEVAEMSGGVWSDDRFVWSGAKYLNGLDYTLCSENGVDPKIPFKSISAYIGPIAKGWSDEATVREYKKIARHLVKLLGQPNERKANPEVPDTETLTWRFGKAEVYLDIIDQFVYKCFLTIGLKV